MEYVDDPLQIYLQEVCKVDPLSREEEAECEGHLRVGGEQLEKARCRLVESNLTMVVTVAELHKNARAHVLDLIICGNEALLAATKTFVELGEGSFSEYARACVEKAIAMAGS